MRDDPLGFAGGALDRAANLRADAGWIAERRRHASSRLIRIAGDRVEIEGGHVKSAHADGAADPVFLGLDDFGHAWFAEEAQFEGGIDLRGIAVAALVPRAELAMLAQARALLQWHGRRRFCSNCGAALAVVDGGYRRHCEACEADHFPRTDPVVIIVVRHGRDCLLGRGPAWPKGRYSALAGFMEPGETIEEAARREVFEEAGIRVGDARYVASQPWPFPSSLMIGLIGEALTDQLTLDRAELEDARWFPPEEAAALLDGTHPQGFTCPPPMAIAYRLMVTALQQS